MCLLLEVPLLRHATPGAEYSIVVKSLSSNAVGYTDVIRVRVAKKNQRRRLPEQLDDDVEA